MVNLERLRGVTGDVLSLLYPQFCVGCDELLISGENQLCTRCRFSLPITDFHFDPKNPVARQFWGKVMLQQATAFLHFQKGGKVQRLIHHLKYRQGAELGVMLGGWYGMTLQSVGFSKQISAILPVPLHRDRERKRGYNQAACFAEGLSQALVIPAIKNNLIRNKATETQTRKSRFDRYRNVEEVFTFRKASELEGKHLLLVDDVITTGSTLAACAAALQTIPGVEVSIAALAFAAP